MSNFIENDNVIHQLRIPKFAGLISIRDFIITRGENIVKITEFVEKDINQLLIKGRKLLPISHAGA